MPETPLQELLPIELMKGLTSSEKVLLEKASVRGPAKFTGVEGERPLRAALLYWLCTDLGASKHVHPKGVWVEGATVEGVLDFEGATLRHPLWLINCVIAEEIVFRDARTRSIKLSGSRTGPLSADRLATRGFVELKGTEVDGKVSLSGADIGGTLNCESAVFDGGEGGVALRAPRVTARGGVFLKRLKAHGTVRLSGAKIGGDLACDGAEFCGGEGGVALYADGITTRGGVFLKRLKAHGTVRLAGAKIEGDLNFDRASLCSAEEYSVNARNLSVKGTLFWRDMDSAPAGITRLLHARVGQLADDAASWPDAKKLILEGFVYDGFGPESPQSARERLRWLELQPADPFRPQPYEQLARVFRLMGREVDARLVLIAKQDARRTHPDLNRRTKVWLWFLGKTIRYGWEPWRVLRFMAVMILIGWAVFSLTDMIPTTQIKPRFNAFIYSLEVFVPLVDLHQERYYLPSGTGLGGAWFQGYFWLHIIMGWVSSTLLAASLTGLIRRD